MSTILGMLVFALGGLAGATFLLPAKGVKGWAYESWWLVYVFIGLIVCPPLICYFTVPDFWHVATSAPAAVLCRCAGFGMMWGVGALAWGLMVRYLGIGLGLAIGCGLAAATGTLIPPIVTGHAGDLVKDAGALTVLGGVIGSLAGIVFVGLAGKLKENELPEEEKKKAVAEFNFKKGIVTAFVAGIFSAGMNFGLQGAEVIENAAVAAGAKECWRGMPVIMVVLWGGFLVELVWCMQQNFKNKTFGDYARPSIRNIVWSALVGIIWVMQFVCTKAGEPLMGEMKYISFAVMMASTIFFSTIIGIILGEWKGTSGKTKGCLALGTLVLVASFCVISLGGKSSAPAAAEAPVARLGVCSWSFQKNLDAVAAHMKEMGVKRIHLALQPFLEGDARHGKAEGAAALAKVKARLAAGEWILNATMLSFNYENYSTLETIRKTGGIVPDEYWAANQKLITRAVALTKELGAPYLTLHAGFLDESNAAAFEKYRARVQWIADACKAAGVKLLLESGQETAEDLAKFLKSVTNVGINFDPANMILYGKGDPVAAIEKLAPWIEHVHVKDAKKTSVRGTWGREVPWGDGEANAAALFAALKKIGYKGSFAIEREGGQNRVADIRLAAERFAEMK